MGKAFIIKKRLEDIIASKNMTLHQFCTYYGFPYSTMSAIVKGESDPKFSTVEEIADVLGIPLSHLICDDVGIDEARAISAENLSLYQRICRYDNHKKWRVVGYMDCLEDDDL